MHVHKQGHSDCPQVAIQVQDPVVTSTCAGPCCHFHMCRTLLSPPLTPTSCVMQGVAGELADQHNPEVPHPGLKATTCLPHAIKVKRHFPLSAPPSPTLSAARTRASRVLEEAEDHHFPFCFCSDHSLGYPLFCGPRDVRCL